MSDDYDDGYDDGGDDGQGGDDNNTMSDSQGGSGGGGGGGEDGSLEAEEVIPDVLLTEEIVGRALSILARTGDGLAHAYVRCELHGTPITHLDVLAKYVHVRYVDVSRNKVKSLAPLSALDQLLTLDAHSNALTTLKDLRSRSFLQTADLSDNRIESADFVEHPMLNYLNLSSNRFNALDGLNGLKGLTTLILENNSIASLTGLSLPLLKSLHLAANRITSLAGLTDLPSLELLDLSNNRLTSGEGASPALSSLTHLNLAANLFESETSLSALAAFPKLVSLVLEESPVASVDNYRLEVLMVVTQLTSLDREPFVEDDHEEARLVAQQKKEMIAQLAAEAEERRLREEAEEKERLAEEAAEAARAARLAAGEPEDGAGSGDGEGPDEGEDDGDDGEEDGDDDYTHDSTRDTTTAYDDDTQ